MLIIVAFANLFIGLAGAFFAMKEGMWLLTLALAVGTLTQFAVLRGLDTIIGLMESIRYNTRKRD